VSGAPGFCFELFWASEWLFPSITAASGCNARNSSAIDCFFASGGKPSRNCYILVLARVEPLHLHVPHETEHSMRKQPMVPHTDTKAAGNPTQRHREQKCLPTEHE
jgi:hypothetical protein